MVKSPHIAKFIHDFPSFLFDIFHLIYVKKIVISDKKRKFLRDIFLTVVKIVWLKFY
jgi:hypothetical protein